MKRITEIIPQTKDPNTVELSEVLESEPIFVRRHDDGKLVGMVVCDKDGWQIRLGGPRVLTAVRSTREACMRDALASGYQFYVED